MYFYLAHMHLLMKLCSSDLALSKSHRCKLNFKDQFIQRKDKVENVPPIIESLWEKSFDLSYLWIAVLFPNSTVTIETSLSQTERPVPQ